MKLQKVVLASLALVLATVSPSQADVGDEADRAYRSDPYLIEAGLPPCPEDYFIRKGYADPIHIKLCDARKYSLVGVRDRLLADQLLEALALAEAEDHSARALIAAEAAEVLFAVGRRDAAVRAMSRHVGPSADMALLQRAEVYALASAISPQSGASQLDALVTFLDAIGPEAPATTTESLRETLMAGWRIAALAFRDRGETAQAERALTQLAAYADGGAAQHRGYALEAWRELARIAFDRDDLDLALERIGRAENAAGVRLAGPGEGYGNTQPDTTGVVLLRVEIELARGAAIGDLFPGELTGEDGDDWRLQLDWNIDFDGETRERRERMLTLLRRIHQSRGLPDLTTGFAIPDMMQLVPTAFEQAQSLAVDGSDAAASFANGLRQMEFEEDRLRLEAYDRVRTRYYQALNRYAELDADAGPEVVSAMLDELSGYRDELALGSEFDGYYDDYPGQPRRYDSILPWYLGLRQWGEPGQVEDMLLIVPADGDIHVFAQGWTGETGFAWHVVEGGEAKIEPLVERLRCQVDPLSCPDDAGFALDLMDPSPMQAKGQLAYDRAAAYELYRLLIQPVEPALTEGSDVFVMTTGAMATLPLAMLVTEAPEEGYDWADYRAMAAAPWLGNRYAFTTAPSFESFRPNRLKPISNVSKDMLFAVADPAFDGEIRPGDARSAGILALSREGRLANVDAIRELAPLPGTRTEYEAMRSALGAAGEVALLGSRATEAELRQHPELGNARYLLLATHGLLPGENDDQLLEPALVFTPPEQASLDNDGLLTASEVRALNLRAEWVFLSACNTAAAGGTGDSLSALASAFLRAGSLQVMASHWPVLDAVTPALTSGTIRASVRAPAGGPGRALQSAMRGVRDGHWPDGTRIDGWEESWAHPMAWAPFVLISNGDEASVNKRFDTDWNP